MPSLRKRRGVICWLAPAKNPAGKNSFEKGTPFVTFYNNYTTKIFSWQPALNSLEFLDFHKKLLKS